ncbi:MAG TPA: alpha-hydroxy acid oxidase [Acidimicrobiia bacterium]|nr:alpha-hydroxy acid oxidase [Acidimicrobiia bacterium]
MTDARGADRAPRRASTGPPVVDLARLEELATARLDAGAAEYINRGAGDGVTLAANRRAWQRRLLRPRVLRDVHVVATGGVVLGTEVRAPVLVAPTAMQRLAAPDGERATARAAARAGTVMVVSMAASCSLEEVAAAAPGAPRWAQMYLLRDRGRTRALAERAAEAGYTAVVASVDGAAVPHGDHGGATPPGLAFPNLAPPGRPGDGDLLATLADFDAGVTAADLARFREWSGLPLVVKGVLRGDDARAGVDAGAAGVVVSNHGGRIVDGSVATGDVLPEVVDAVGGDAEVYVDGGIRGGADVVKALALGARAVMVGRPAVWGLALDGEEGVVAVLDALTRDLGRVMAFCGAADLSAVTRDLLASASP